MNVLERIAASGVVPVVRIERAEDAPALTRVLRDAGLACIEITFRSAAAAESIRAIRTEVPDVLVGAGTVISRAQLDEALAAGAEFIVSPGLQVDVVRACQGGGTPVLPGVFTPTEVIQAMDLGLSVVKLFPAVIGGRAGISAHVGRPVPGAAFRADRRDRGRGPGSVSRGAIGLGGGWQLDGPSGAASRTRLGCGRSAGP